jgi:hypothetical protein
MALVTGGDIKEISWSNSLLGAGFFMPVAGSDSTYDLGGYRGNDQAVLDGGGRLINQLNLKPWMFQVEVSNDMGDTKEFETASAIAASTAETTWTFSHINGFVYKGVGVIQGDLQLNGNKSTFTLKVTGGGVLQQI